MTLTYCGSSFRLSFTSSKIHQIQFSYSYMSFTICTSLQIKFHYNVVKQYQKLNNVSINLLFFQNFFLIIPILKVFQNITFFVASLLLLFQKKTKALVKQLVRLQTELEFGFPSNKYHKEPRIYPEIFSPKEYSNLIKTRPICSENNITLT